jgi:hypothetical protein
MDSLFPGPMKNCPAFRAFRHSMVCDPALLGMKSLPGPGGFKPHPAGGVIAGSFRVVFFLSCHGLKPYLQMRVRIFKRPISLIAGHPSGGDR